MNKGFLFFLILLSPIFLIAQSNYTKGEVVTTSGDTLKGFINYIEWYRIPDNIQFKYRNEDIRTQTFTVDNAIWFGVAGYVAYARYDVSISMDPVSFGSLTEQVDTVAVTKAVFLKEVLKGDRIDLYSYSDEIKQRFYILDKRQTIPLELIYRKTLIDMQEVSQEVFKRQLSKVAVQYGVFTTNLNDLIQKSEYSKGDLQKIITKINSVNETGITHLVDKKRRTAFFVSMGVNRDRIDYTGHNLITVDKIDNNGFDKYKNIVTTENYLPRFSTGIDFFINPAIRRLIVRTELSATKMKSTVQSYYQFSEYTKPVENTYRLSSWNISFIPQVIFNYYNTVKCKGYFGVGGSFSHLFTSDNYMQQREINQTSAEARTMKDYFPFDRFTLSAIVRSGVQINERVDLSFIWTNPVEYTNYAGGRGEVKAGLLAFSATYFFRK